MLGLSEANHYSLHAQGTPFPLLSGRDQPTPFIMSLTSLQMFNMAVSQPPLKDVALHA